MLYLLTRNKQKEHGFKYQKYITVIDQKQTEHAFDAKMYIIFDHHKQTGHVFYVQKIYYIC